MLMTVVLLFLFIKPLCEHLYSLLLHVELLLKFAVCFFQPNIFLSIKG